MMKCLVLGADGFMGSHLVDKLYENGYKVRAFDRFRDGKSNNLNHLRGNIEFFAGDFLNQQDIEKATTGIDIVFHFISLTTPASSINDPFIDIDTNIRGTIQLLDKCVKNNIKQFVFSSSGGTVYGNHLNQKFSEDTLTVPTSPYGIAKLTIERYLEYYKINFDLDYICIRYANPYGPRQNSIGSQGIIPIFLQRNINNEPVVIFGDGSIVRDYIYIDDCIDLTCKLVIGCNHSVYNIGSGEGTTINEIIKIIERITGKRFKIKKEERRNCDVGKIILDNSRITTEKKIENFMKLEDGIKITYDYFNY